MTLGFREMTDSAISEYKAFNWVKEIQGGLLVKESLIYHRNARAELFGSD